MKKLISLLTILTMVVGAKATVYDSIGFPDHVVARMINDTTGMITDEYVADFIYGPDGVLTDYTFIAAPGDLHTTFSFYKYPDKPTCALYEAYDSGTNMTIFEKFSFTYENEMVKRREDRWYSSSFDFLDVWSYSYENHHLSQENFSSYLYTDVVRNRHIYTYENNYRTRIDQYYREYMGNFVFSEETTTHYNDLHKILNIQKDQPTSGGLIPTELQTYTYTSQNKVDSIITQTYNDGTWDNSKFEHYVYDGKNRVVEYQKGVWSSDDSAWNVTKKINYDFDDANQKLTISFHKKEASEWVWDEFNGESLFNDSSLVVWQEAMNFCFYGSRPVCQFEFSMHYDKVEPVFPNFSEWFYTIEWEDGSVTYQHLEHTADTTIENKRPKVIVRSNTQYDKNRQTEVTHEYIYEENDKVFWWNKDLQEFTVLYDYAAEPGDEWEIKVGEESITVHVDNVDIIDYQGENRKVITISDAEGVFNGDIVVGFGHLTSFFPERLMRSTKGFRVNGLRCYWADDALLYHNGDDCDAIYGELHGVEEMYENGYAVYPNPANSVLFVETCHGASLQGNAEYRITNLMGQTLLQGSIDSENQQIDINMLPAGMYFLTVEGETIKFVIDR